ncbi:MAG: ribonuclease P protein component [Polyangiales bacterium]
MSVFGFGRASRMRKRYEFQLVQREGEKTHSKYFLVFVRANPFGHCRLGITVTKKIGSAVRRNHIKRIIREVFRLHPQTFDFDQDIVVIAKQSASSADSDALRSDFLRWAQARKRTAR